MRTRSRRIRRSAFTLVEMLIVVAALAILSGVIIPQVEFAVADARQTAMLSDQRELNSAIERYRMEHSATPPEIDNNNLPQLLQSTDFDGNIGQGSQYILGPYIRHPIPPNPLNGSRKVYYSATTPPTNLEQRVGWIYNTETGQLWGGLSQQWVGPNF